MAATTSSIAVQISIQPSQKNYYSDSKYNSLLKAKYGSRRDVESTLEDMRLAKELESYDL